MVAVPRIVRPDPSLQHAVYRALDALAIVGSLSLMVTLLSPADLERCGLVGGCALIAFFVSGELSQLYRRWQNARPESELSCVASTWAVCIALLAIPAYITGYLSELPRRTVLSWLAIAPAIMLSYRIVLRWQLRCLRRYGWNTRQCAIVGINPLATQFARNLKEAPDLGLDLVGFFDDRDPAREEPIDSELGQWRGSIDDLLQLARAGEVETVFITLPLRAEHRIRKDILARFSDTTASVYVVPDFFVFEMLHARWSDVGGLPVVSVFESPLFGVDGILKRALDLALGCLALLIFAVPMLTIAALIKLTSNGPIFFRQKRYGLDGKELRIWKFRTMTVCEDGAQVTQARQGDSRVTRLGAILRKTSLDEIPQLFNVISGAMSLVGPRPHATAHNEQYRKLIPGYMLRHKVKPGITGLAQVKGWRGETDTLEKMERRVEFDHMYIRNWSIWLDIKILFQTVIIVWTQKNAY